MPPRNSHGFYLGLATQAEEFAFESATAAVGVAGIGGGPAFGCNKLKAKGRSGCVFGAQALGGRLEESCGETTRGRPRSAPSLDNPGGICYPARLTEHDLQHNIMLLGCVVTAIAHKWGGKLCKPP